MDHLFSISRGLNKWGNAFLKTVEYKLGMKKTIWGAVVLESTESLPTSRH